VSNARAGFTLLEVMVALAIVALVIGLVYGSFAGTAESKDFIENGNEVYHQGRWAMDKMEADLSTSFLNTRANSYTLFYGVNREGAENLPNDELHFTSYNHVKYNPTAQESDQQEVSYFVAENPDTGEMTLYRREDPNVDQDNTAGGEVYELATGVIAFNIRYYDGTQWVDDWDSRKFTAEQNVQTEVEQTDEMVNALPLAAEVTLILLGPRDTQIAFHTKVRILLSSIDLSIGEEDQGAQGSPTPAPDGAGKAGGGDG